MARKKTIDDWLDEYGETHRHPFNRKIHKICVPAIFWSVIALLRALPVPAGWGGWFMNWAGVGLAAILIFYAIFALRYLPVMAGFGGLALLLSSWLAHLGWSLAWIAAPVFVLAWIGQFYGHKIEGRRPAFLQDLTFLLIGPIWVFKKNPR